MTGISTTVIDGDKVVSWKGKHLKTFSKYDDYAFTKGNEYAEELRRTSEEDFKKIYPEFFL